MTDTRTWTNQPIELVGLPKLFHGSVGDAIAEVCAGESGFFLTVGTIFDSQTIRCPSLESVLAAMNLVANKRKHHPARIPEGCTIMKAA